MLSGRGIPVVKEIYRAEKRKEVIALAEHAVAYTLTGAFCIWMLKNPLKALEVYAIAFCLVAPIELALISRGVLLWRDLKGVPLGKLLVVFGWSALNITIYFLIGVFLGVLLLR